MVSQNYRWRDHVETVRRRSPTGVIGELGYVTLAFHRGHRFGGWREQLPDVLLEDMSIHHFDLLRHLTGRNCRRHLRPSFHPHWSWFCGQPVGLRASSSMEGGLRGQLLRELGLARQETSWARRVADRRREGRDPLGRTRGDRSSSATPRTIRATRSSRRSALAPETLEHIEFAYSLYEFARGDRRGPRAGHRHRRQHPELRDGDGGDRVRSQTGRPVDVQAFLS